MSVFLYESSPQKISWNNSIAQNYKRNSIPQWKLDLDCETTLIPMEPLKKELRFNLAWLILSEDKSVPTNNWIKHAQHIIYSYRFMHVSTLGFARTRGSKQIILWCIGMLFYRVAATWNNLGKNFSTWAIFLNSLCSFVVLLIACIFSIASHQLNSFSASLSVNVSWSVSKLVCAKYAGGSSIQDVLTKSQILDPHPLSTCVHFRLSPECVRPHFILKNRMDVLYTILYIVFTTYCRIRGGLGRRDTGKIPGGPPGPVILIIIKLHKENKSREDRAAFFFFFPGRAAWTPQSTPVSYSHRTRPSILLLGKYSGVRVFKKRVY